MEGKLFEEEKKYFEDIIRLHFDKEEGTPYWINKAWESGVNPEDIATIEDVNKYFPLTNSKLKEDFDRALRKGNYKELVPRSKLKDVYIVGESGGTTGPAKRAAFTKKEWFELNIDRINKALDYIDFPKNVDWLNALPPYPPHIVGKTGIDFCKTRGGQPFGIDLDPRILKKFGRLTVSRNEEEKKAAGMAINLYMGHIGEQIKNVLGSENDIRVIYTTPIILKMLPRYVDRDKLKHIEGLFYAGTKMDEDTYRIIREELFPGVSILGVYGSGHLGGIAIQLPLEDNYEIIYAPLHPLFKVEVVNEDFDRVNYGERGKILISKYGESLLMPRYPDEDTGILVEPPEEYKKLGVDWPCIKDIAPTEVRAKKEVGGVY